MPPIYLIRRRDVRGRYVTVDSVPNPDRPIEEIVRDYGIGHYSILLAETGKQGLRHYRDIIVPPVITFRGYYSSRPDGDAMQLLGVGDYFITRLSNPEPYEIHRDTTPSDEDTDFFDRLRSIAPAMKVWAVFQVDRDNIPPRR